MPYDAIPTDNSSGSAASNTATKAYTITNRTGAVYTQLGTGSYIDFDDIVEVDVSSLTGAYYFFMVTNGSTSGTGTVKLYDAYLVS